MVLRGVGASGIGRLAWVGVVDAKEIGLRGVVWEFFQLDHR